MWKYERDGDIKLIDCYFHILFIALQVELTIEFVT